ncbi:MAG TPA: DNA repair protein RecO [Bacteroidota bacterium]|nr:DNA repair protein RecO [Bacteroidota bacterium]
MITKTEAVVLKSMKFRESSKIVTFYTRNFGKVRCLAKGARQLKSKMGASLQPITAVSLVLYKKEHRELQLLSQCDATETYNKIHGDLERMAAALAVLELVNQLVHDEEENSALYSLLRETLDAIEHAKKNVLNLWLAFQIRLAAVFGFSPDLEACSGCGRSLDEIGADGSAVFQLSRGSFVCGRCLRPQSVEKFNTIASVKKGPGEAAGKSREDGNTRVSVGTLKVLHRILKARLDSVASLELPGTVRNEIDGTLRLYLRQHFEDLKPIRSLDILKSYSA